MSVPVGDGDCRGNLVARAQRAPLSAPERAALIAHLSSCESCRLLQQVAFDFAETRAVDRGDEVRLEEMAVIARRASRRGARVARPSRPRWYARAAAAAAGVALIAGSASATAWLWPRLAWHSAGPQPVTRRPAIEPAQGAASRLPASPVALPPPPSEAPTPAAAVPARERAVVRSHERASTRMNAGDLLRQARDAKTDGNGAQAVTLYGRLQKEFPASSEALVAAVPLGRLLLDRASAQAALAQFDRYLGGVPGGALEPEALYGRAQAEARLGDRAAERESWRRLISAYPDSPYSALGRRRLSEPQ